MRKTKAKRLVLLFGVDLVLLGVFLCVFALFHHVLPRKIGHLYGGSGLPQEQDFSLSFPDKFTDGAVVSQEHFYNDENLYLTLNTYEENGVRYHVADFYVRSLRCFLTAMASPEFATGVADSVLNMAEENGALLAVSGDYFGIRQRGIVIRNGKVYRKTRAHQVCVLYYDGTLETYPFASFDVDKAIAGGAWQAWDFGPILLDETGKAITEFDAGIAGENPRIALGYFEPGHYCLVAVDGRQEASRGMTLPELSALMERLGCRRAYNMDGGHSAVMAYRGALYSSPSKKGGRDISDIIYLSPTPLAKEEKEDP